MILNKIEHRRKRDPLTTQNMAVEICGKHDMLGVDEKHITTVIISHGEHGITLTNQ